jgi:integrating conjugative element membrane protein (TIGR03745 family)
MKDKHPALGGLTAKLAAYSQRIALLITGLSITAQQALADLPTMAEPTRGITDGDYIRTGQDYAYDIGIFIGLAIATVAMFVVVKNSLSSYSEVQDGKGTWGQLGLNFGVGVLLLVFIVFLLTEAATIL